MWMKFSDPPTSNEVVEVLRAVAAAYVVKNVSYFRITAYQKAADSIEHASRQVYEIWKDNQLKQLPGIGGSIGDHLEQLLAHGNTDYFEEVFEGLPDGMFALLPVPGVGPKTAHKLAVHLGLTRYHSALSKLEKACRQNEVVKNVPGIKEDGQARILAGIEEYKQRGDRVLLYQADKIARQIIDWLQPLTQIERIEPLGSLRRRANTVGDVDIAVASTDPKTVIDKFVQYPFAQRVVEAGEVTATIALEDQTHVDLMVLPAEQFGSLLQHFTGSKAHNIVLREYALKLGLSLSERGITDVESEELREYETEEGFYLALGLPWIAPELRENKGELEAAQTGKLPELVELGNLKGEFHLHSDFPIEPSHDLGLSSMREMADWAIEHGYEYLAFSEHNPAMEGHSESDVVELVKRKGEQIAKLNQTLKDEGMTFRAFNSLEIDIRPDGALALPEKALEYVDVAVVSLHSSFRQSEGVATKRVLSGLSHPKCRILGHPTARVINQRPGVDLDWEQLFNYCLEHDKWLDIDGWPERRDLPEDLVREAVKRGVKMAISSDAHQVDHMGMIRYGVDTARRGWCEKRDIVNTRGLREVEQWLGV